MGRRTIAAGDVRRRTRLSNGGVGTAWALGGCVARNYPVSYETALSVQRLKALGRKQGFVTYEQVNLELNPSLVDPDKIAAVVEQIERGGVRVVEHPPEKGTP
jgi:hypothetical protein